MRATADRLDAAGDCGRVLGEVTFDDAQLEPREDRFLRLTFEQKLERGFEQPFGRRARRIPGHVLIVNGHVMYRPAISFLDRDLIDRTRLSNDSDLRHRAIIDLNARKADRRPTDAGWSSMGQDCL